MDTDSKSLIDMKYKIIYQNDHVVIKGNYIVASYDENLIIIKSGGDNICINGEDIVISSLSADEIYISGSINSISFA